jgi:hypothetical protein
VSIGGERFIAQQLKPGSWSVLDRHYRELVGSADKATSEPSGVRPP